MTVDVPNRRREDGEQVRPPLSARAALYLDLVADRVAAADLEADGSPAALALAQEAIGYTALALSRHLDAAYPTSSMAERDQWLSVVRFLSGTLMFQQPLQSLTLALTELDRGIVAGGLKRTSAAQGGVPSERKLRWMKLAVEVADEFVRQHGGHREKAEASMNEIEGVSASNITKWRKKLTRLAPEHHPHSFRRWMPAGIDEAAIRAYVHEEGLGDPEDPDVVNDPEIVECARLAPLAKELRTFCERVKKDIP